MSDSFKKELLFDLGLLLLIAAVFLGGFAYFRLEFGRFAEKRSALSAKMDAHGRGWSRASGRPTTEAPICCRRTSRIRPRHTSSSAANGVPLRWSAPRPIAVVEDPEMGERAFESDFDLDETTVTLRRVKAAGLQLYRPEKRAYVLTKAADYEQALAALPFTPADS